MQSCLSCLNNLNIINAGSAGFMLGLRNPWLTRVMIFVTTLGNPSSMSLLCLALVLALWLHKKPHHIIQFAFSLLMGLSVSWIVKELVQLPRPVGGLIPETGYSFASGHAAVAVIFFFLIAYSYKGHIRSRFLRVLFVCLNAFMALLIGFSRVYLGVHYATDVLFGFLIGLVVSALSILFLQSYERRHAVIESDH